MNGIFIVIEGIDGVGKTTIAKMLKNHFEKEGKKVVLTSEPTEGEYGKILREKLKEGMDPIEAVLLFALDRYVHVKEIKKLVSAGYVVISDRYYYSSIAYQGALLGANFEEYILKVHEPFIYEPDVAILLDAPPDVALKRIEGSKRLYKEIYENMELQEKIRENYLRLASRMNNFVVIDASKNSPEEVFKATLAAINKKLKERNKL